MDNLHKALHSKLICCLLFVILLGIQYCKFFNKDFGDCVILALLFINAILFVWITILFVMDLCGKNDNPKYISEMTQEEFKALLEKTIRDTAKIKSGIANVAATKHFVTENVEELKKEINKALKDNASDSMKIKLINNLVQKNDKRPILFNNGTFMSCLKAILELDKNKEKQY